jgi:hypothetical protein
MANAIILQDFQLDKSPVTGVAAGWLASSASAKTCPWNQRFGRANNTAGRCSPAAIRSCSSNSGGVWQLAVGARLVDGVRNLLREDLGDLIDGNIVLRGELLDRIASQYLL